MPLFTKSYILEKFREPGIVDMEKLAKVTSRILILESKKFNLHKTYDIFLSHSYDDSPVILALKREIELYDFSIYVDWLEDPLLDRRQVSKRTAEILKSRMHNCKGLIFVYSENSPYSLWMPWELGYFDGTKEKVAILPILERNIKTEEYEGQDYLGLYPYITINELENNGTALFVNEDRKTYVELRRWLSGENPNQH